MYSTELSIYMKLDLRSVVRSLAQLTNALELVWSNQKVAIEIRIATLRAIRRGYPTGTFGNIELNTSRGQEVMYELKWLTLESNTPSFIASTNLLTGPNSIDESDDSTVLVFYCDG